MVSDWTICFADFVVTPIIQLCDKYDAGFSLKVLLKKDENENPKNLGKIDRNTLSMWVSKQCRSNSCVTSTSFGLDIETFLFPKNSYLFLSSSSLSSSLSSSSPSSWQSSPCNADDALLDLSFSLPLLLLLALCSPRCHYDDENGALDDYGVDDVYVDDEEANHLQGWVPGVWPGLLETRPGGRPGEEGAAGLLLLLLAHQPPSPVHHRRSPRLRLCQGSPIATLPLNPGQVPREHQHLLTNLPWFFNQARRASQPFLFGCFCTIKLKGLHISSQVDQKLEEMETSVSHGLHLPT